MSLLACIPTDELHEFLSLPAEVQQEVRSWLSQAQRIIDAGRRGQALRDAAEALGVSFKTAETKFYRFLKAGDWRAFVDWRKAAPAAAAVSDEDKDLVRMYCERNQRKSDPAIRALRRDWRDGKVKTSTPVDPRTGYPAGWSVRNLRRHAPTKFELAAARIGRSRAADFRPLVLTTRVGLRVGQYYLADDIWHDNKVQFIGGGRSGIYRPLEFHMLDLFSACKFAWGIKPRLENEDTGRMSNLNMADFRFLLAKVLAVDGYRTDDIGTTFVLEHGTTTLDESLEADLWDHFRIRVNRSGIDRGTAHAGQFAGVARGNFRFKAALESLGNLIHNELAALPGQVGMDRDHCPEEQHAREKYGQALCNALLALPQERRMLLRSPFVEYHKFCAIAAEVYARINTRTEHNLEGWIEAGLTVEECRLSTADAWQPMLALQQRNPAALAAVEAIVTSSADLMRTRLMSPAEVYLSGKGELSTLPPHGVWLVLPPSCGVECRVERSLFTFQDSEISPRPLVYLAEVNRRLLPEGEKYLLKVNPFALGEVLVGDARGRFVGVCRAWQRVRRDDVEGLHQQCGQAARVESELLAPVARRGAELARERTEMHRHNAQVLGETLPADRKARKTLRKNFAGGAEELLGESNGAAGHAEEQGPAAPNQGPGAFDATELL